MLYYAHSSDTFLVSYFRWDKYNTKEKIEAIENMARLYLKALNFDSKIDISIRSDNFINNNVAAVYNYKNKEKTEIIFNENFLKGSLVNSKELNFSYFQAVFELLMWSKIAYEGYVLGLDKDFIDADKLKPHEDDFKDIFLYSEDKVLEVHFCYCLGRISFNESQYVQFNYILQNVFRQN